MKAGQRRAAPVWAVISLAGAVGVVESCAQAEGIGGSNPAGGAGGGAGDASVGGSATGGTASGGAAGNGGGATGGVAGGGGSVGGGGSGGSTGGGSGGSTGGSGGSTGGSGGSTGGSGGSTGGSGGSTGGSGGSTGGSGGSTGGSGGSAGCPIKTYDFADCTGWTAAGTKSDWQCGAPSAGPPNGDHTGGGKCWGTKLAGNATNCQDSTLTSPVIDLSAASGKQPRLRFWHYYDFRACNPAGLCGAICALENSTYSGGIVEVTSNGSTWTKVAPTSGGTKIECYSVDSDGGTTCTPCALDGQTGYSGKSPGWELVEIDVSAYATSTFQARFHFASYALEFLCHPDKPGWYIDDVSIVKLTCP
ncbi:MAG: hypothetical protein HYZ29_30185 [Myxococcales bacterium]|nr:hypothetical protein [Myxococcales bacterium]